MDFTEILGVLSTLLGLMVSLCYSYQILYLLLPLFHKQPSLPEGKLHRYAILIAARNEEQVLPHLLESLFQQDYPAQLYRVFVVADNCTDRTAVVAAQMGAVVFSRHSSTHIGKGYALQYLLQKIDEQENLDSFDAFLVFDADNLLCKDYIRQIDRVCSQGYDVFCGFRNSKNFGTNWVSMGHAIWYLHDCVHLNASRMALGYPAIVTGTGFGFTRSLLQRCGGWNFFTLTEDIEFSTWCVTHNVSSGYCRDAVVYDEQPITFRQSWRQRTRWIQGGIQVSLRYGKALFTGIVQGGKNRRNCLESVTLLLWGYGIGVISALLAMVSAFLQGGWPALGQALVFAVVGSFLFSVLIAALAVGSSWSQIRATTAQKLLGILLFPLHTLTYAPIAVSALFRKYHWPQIDHTLALSVQDLHP